MAKKTGFNIRIDAFIPIDKTNFAAQAAAFQTIADIQKTGKLPDGFFDTATILGITPKQGTADVPDAVTDEPVLPIVADADDLNPPVTEMVGDKVSKRGDKPAAE